VQHHVRSWVQTGAPCQSVAIDPDVWSGRALQVDFAGLEVSGLASMYPVSIWSHLAPDYHGYWDKLALHKRWVSLHLENAVRLREAFEKANTRATLDTANGCLRIDNALNICFRIAKFRKYQRRPLRWTLMNRVKWPKGWVVALRLGENNETILDYVLLPSAALTFVHRLFWFSEATRPAHRIERFETFEELSRSLVKRVCKTRSTGVAGRLKPKHGARKGKRF
jgi:hypothetical protein